MIFHEKLKFKMYGQRKEISGFIDREDLMKLADFVKKNSLEG